MTGFFSKIQLFVLLTTAVFLPPVAAESAGRESAPKKVESRWKNGEISISLSDSLEKFSANIKMDSDVSGAVKRSLETWEKAANIKFTVSASDKSAVSSSGVSGDGTSLITLSSDNENLLLFGEDAAEVSAKTRVFYDQTGEIAEADIALNPFVQFSTDGTFGTFDLEATLTHEIGHLLGLEHTSFCSTSMYTHQARNGIYNLPQNFSRTLSEIDISNIRARYGAPVDVSNCCGIVKGKLSLPGSIAGSGFLVWLEDSKTGQVRAGSISGIDGTFSLGGVTAGRYRIFVQDSGIKQKNRKKMYAGDLIGEVSVENSKTVTFDKELNLPLRTFNINYLGFNGQLSNVSVPVNNGKSFRLYFGGENINPSEIKVYFNSPLLKISGNKLKPEDFGLKLNVTSFEFAVRNNLPLGDYTTVVEKNTGEKYFLIGSITADQFENPWSSADNSDSKQ